jgi:uncharacterized membrane protein YgdD (TMEM256/DUF423 family)
MNAARLFLVLGAANAALAVALGAFGAHMLKARLAPELLAVYHTGAQYHFYHALGLVLAGLALAQFPGSAALRWAGWVMLAGIVLFSGSLYGLSLGGWRALGALAPLGGTAFIAAWLLFAVGVWRGS